MSIFDYCHTMAKAIENNNMSWNYAIWSIQWKYGCDENTACNYLSRFTK